MQWERMTVDEYAAFQQANGVKLVKIDGIWWTEVRPFFFRPALPYIEISPKTKAYPSKSILGGVQHAVPEGIPANSSINFFILEEIQDYSLSKLSAGRRNAVRRGLKNFTERRIENETEFAEEAYDIYVSFYNRTKYAYMKKRLDREYFYYWAKTLFQHPKIYVMGAFHHDRLCAVSISYFIEGVLVYATLFSDKESQKHQVTDFILHVIRDAAASTDARFIFAGMATGQTGLDGSKLERGFRLIEKPAYHKMNPIVLMVVKVFMRNSYNKITGRGYSSAS